MTKRGKLKKSDYSWLPVLGIVTPKSIDLLKAKKRIQIKDGSFLSIYSLSEFEVVELDWMIENPGKQMFTGSFHPIEDQSWEDRQNWDSKVPLGPVSTFRDIFMAQKAVKTKEIDENAMKVLQRFRPFLGQDVLDIIYKELRNKDKAMLCAVCKPFPEFPKRPKLPGVEVLSDTGVFEYSIVVGIEIVMS